MNIIFRTLGEARELTPRYLGIILTSVLVSASALATPFLTKVATDEVVAQLGGGGGGVVVLVWIALALLAVELLNTVLSNIAGYLGDTMAVRLRAILSSRYYGKLLGLPQRYFDTQLTGTIVTACIGRSPRSPSSCRRSATTSSPPSSRSWRCW